MQYQVSLVISPAKGCLARLFSVKGRLTKGVLEIYPETRSVRIYGTDPMVTPMEHNLSFDDIQEIESPGPEWLIIRLRTQREIQLKNIETLVEILTQLSQYVPDVTHELVRRRIERYEERLARWSKK